MRNIDDTTGSIIRVSDLRRELPAVKKKAEKAMRRVLDAGRYILGEELASFEREFAHFCGSSYAIAVASGTDALELSLRALSIGKGHEVIVPVNTAIPTVMALCASGSEPKFVDVEVETFNIDVLKLEKAITKRTKAIIPVHLYGNPCDMDIILRIAKKNELFVIEDACQAHGALYKGKKAGTFGTAGAFSFYPTKNLGCFGDGGAITTNNKKMADRIRLMRNYGQRTRYICDEKGTNSRLDEVQAAILRIKLKYLAKHNERRREIARLYGRYLDGIEEVKTPSCESQRQHVFHLYVIRCKHRDRLKKYLSKKAVETEIHYPIPLHLQKAFKYLGHRKGDFPLAEKLSNEILSLPMFPALEKREIKTICNSIKDFYAHSG